ncbi:MAG TPA: glycosyltransferase [Pyrinomonadaceae bacterium]|jgi:glycosyltransferase involved in cell wall biosynthesis|nr:glycosyltransferase [Pyrinomonadaceae bacterium]
MPAVSVIIPTHNRARLLSAAIESVRLAGSDLEIIVVDDASTDNTPEICERVSGIRYLRFSDNRGLAQARNAGILAASGELVAFLDDDDRRLPGSLDAQRAQLEAEPNAAFCYGRWLEADAIHHLPTGDVSPKRCPGGDLFWDLLEQNFIAPITVVARKRILIEHGMFRSVPGIEDWDLWLRVAERWPVIVAKDPVAIYRRASLESEQMCSDSVAMYRQMFRVQELALRLPRAAQAPAWKRRRARSRLLRLAYNAMVFEAETALNEGDGATVRVKSREALRLRPWRGRTDLNLLRLLRTV